MSIENKHAMQSGRKYKVAMIGCGRRGVEHAGGLKSDERCEVAALADASAEAAEALGKQFDFGARIYTDYHDLLAKEKPEIVVSCLWPGLHLPVFRDCADAGVRAVLSEKPMAATWGECLEMARIAEQSGCQLTFCHQRRFAAGNLLARRLIREGVFGDPLRMDLYSPRNLLDCGTHTLDQALSFLDETPARWVLGAVDASETLNWFNVRAEIMAAGLIVFNNGVRANLQVGGPDMDFWGGVRLIGKKGLFAVNWHGQFQEAVVYAEPSWRVPELPEYLEADHMAGVIRAAVDGLETGAEPDHSHKKALRASEIIFALYESVRRHAKVDLPLTGVTDNPFITMYEQGEFAKSSGKE